MHKDVLAPGAFIFGRQTVDTSLKRYMEYIHPVGDLTEKQFKMRLMRLRPGQATVKLPDGIQKVVQFSERESEHLSHTPKIQAAMNRYGNKALPAHSSGAYLPEVITINTPTRTSQPLNERPATKPPTFKAQIAAILAKNADTPTSELVAMTGCSYVVAQQHRRALDYPAPKKVYGPSVVRARVEALLKECPAIDSRTLGYRAHCSFGEVPA